MDLSPESDNLHWLVVHHFTSLTVHCLHSHVLDFTLDGLCESNFVVFDIPCRNGSDLGGMQLLVLGEVEKDGGTDQLSIYVLDFAGAERTVGEILVTILICPADEGGEGEFSLGGVEQLILDESFISWLGFAWLYLAIAEYCFYGHEAGFIIRAP